MRDLLTELPVGFEGAWHFCVASWICCARGRLVALVVGCLWQVGDDAALVWDGPAPVVPVRVDFEVGWDHATSGRGARQKPGRAEPGRRWSGFGEPDRGAVAVRTPAPTGRAVVAGDRGAPFGGARPGAGGTVRVGQPGQPAGPTVGGDVGAELAVDLSRPSRQDRWRASRGGGLAPPPVITASRTHAAYRSNVPILG